jgi:hypothetical protein
MQKIGETHFKLFSNFFYTLANHRRTLFCKDCGCGEKKIKLNIFWRKKIDLIDLIF